MKNKVIRLSIANLKKHKFQAILLMILFMITMAVASTAIGSQADMQKIFPNVADKYAVHKSMIMIKDSFYNDSFIDILKQDERVTDVEHFETLFSTASRYLDTNGEEHSLYMQVLTENQTQRITKCEPETLLSKEERAGLEHPIYLPYAGKDSSGFKEGDKFIIIFGAKQFEFTVAGFYEAIFLGDQNNGYSIVVSDEDFRSLMSVFDRWETVLFDSEVPEDSEDIYNEYRNRIEDSTGLTVGLKMMPYTYVDAYEMSLMYITIIVYIMLFMSAVVLAASLVMIRFRIAGDILDQVQFIGVLEALGYTSREITLAYTAEYLITALIGITAGTILSPMLIKMMHGVGEVLSGHHGEFTLDIGVMCITALVILVITGMIAFLRARMVKKYPPVVAFRKGIETHHFGKNPLPLRNTHGNINVRIAMKAFLQNTKRNVGITLCIAITAVAAAVGVIMVDSFGSEMEIARRMAGCEFSDYSISVAEYADVNEVAENIRQLPGVRKTLVGTFSLDIGNWKYITAYDKTEELVVVSYEDFGECENLNPSEGKMPEHENEAVVSMTFAARHGLKVGDNLTVEVDRTKKNYIISGLITAVTNNGDYLYVTHKGLNRLSPNIRPLSIDVYLEEGTDKEEFMSLLLDTYGKSITDTRKDGSEGDSEEERIRALADQRIAELLSTHGISHAEYSVQVGDIVISGTSDGFVIRNVQNLNDLMMTQIGGLFHAIYISAIVFLIVTLIVVTVIISILMEQTIRRQRRELGVMLSMGYTSKNLMFQSALKIMPAVLIAAVAGTIGGSVLFTAIMSKAFGTFVISKLLLGMTAVLLTMFCFVSAYIGSAKIKKISVTELMTE